MHIYSISYRIYSIFSSKLTFKSWILASEKRGPSCQNWGHGGGLRNSGKRKRFFFNWSLPLGEPPPINVFLEWRPNQFVDLFLITILLCLDYPDMLCNVKKRPYFAICGCCIVADKNCKTVRQSKQDLYLQISSI